MDSDSATSPESPCFDRRLSAHSASAAPISPSTSSGHVWTPESDDDLPLKIDSPTVTKVEDNADDRPSSRFQPLPSPQTPPTLSAPALRKKRGRPRIHPVVASKKALHPRSKTGCKTCRVRKKKCDETKPICMNCDKNNYQCDYPVRRTWHSGKSQALVVRRPPLPFELPLLVEGIEGPVDQMLFQHFTGHLGKLLSLTDYTNPFFQYIVPMALEHAGLMHSVLYLSATVLIANAPHRNDEWERRQEHHSSRAMRLLHEDIAQSAGAESQDAVIRVGDSSVAAALILTLQTVCSGDLSGSYRYHLNAMKEMLTAPGQPFPNEQFRQFILEFLLYHDYGSSITSFRNPLDQRSLRLMENFALPADIMMQPQAGALLGVLDGLFGYLSHIRQLRDIIRERRRQGDGFCLDDSIMSRAFAIDQLLRNWTPIYAPATPRYLASMLYRGCTFIYLLRTIHPSHASPLFQRAVDEGLEYLRALNASGADGDDDASSTQSILLMPLFLLGCAAFQPDQRIEIRAALDRLQEWSSLGNIKYARAIVEQLWEMMDNGQEDAAWDWEAIIHSRGWDFLIT